MLYIIFGEADNSVYHPPTYFDNRYEDQWITEALTVEMIKDVDKSDVVGAHLIQSPVLGPISTKEIVLALVAWPGVQRGGEPDAGRSQVEEVGGENCRSDGNRKKINTLTTVIGL